MQLFCSAVWYMNLFCCNNWLLHFNSLLNEKSDSDDDMLVKSNPALEFTRDCSALEIHTDSNIESTSEFVCR